MLRRTEQTYEPSSLFGVKTSVTKTQQLRLESLGVLHLAHSVTEDGVADGSRVFK